VRRWPARNLELRGETHGPGRKTAGAGPLINLLGAKQEAEQRPGEPKPTRHAPDQRPPLTTYVPGLCVCLGGLTLSTPGLAAGPKAGALPRLEPEGSPSSWRSAGP